MHGRRDGWWMGGMMLPMMLFWGAIILGAIWLGGMMLPMVLFWGAIILGAIWVIRGVVERRPHRRDEAIEILDRRLAEGAITFDEYREKKTTLSGG